MEPIVSTKVSVQFTVDVETCIETIKLEFEGVQIMLNSENSQIIGKMLLEVSSRGSTIAAAMKAYKSNGIKALFPPSNEEMREFFNQCLLELQKQDQVSVIS